MNDYEIAYPLPGHLFHEVEALLAHLPDREDTVFKLRRHFGKVYAIGYQEGRVAASTEAYHDHAAKEARP